MHNFLIINTDWVPEHLKTEATGYFKLRFNKDKSQFLIDNAHSLNTFISWIGETEEAYETLQQILKDSECVARAEFRRREGLSNSPWRNEEQEE